MDFFFCIPLVFGCPNKIRPTGDQTPRICPRSSMFAAKSRIWFEFCFVPLIPLQSKDVWMCGICQLQTVMQPGWEPPVAGPGHGYQPTYVQYG
ncbi:hypothetical protein EDD16DRAFT_1692857 [Pisolithus croceorrhizus]|nr:hypothetical protein EDD16DRAFT_1692857 [Pisolithus croceorrhizus]KAI6164345.1 hypothetical protein EDD17DRAFT_1775705 [Pisolithus thermaeus]